MAKHQPTHLQILFLRTVRVQKNHIAGEKAPEGPHDFMRIVQKGETLSVALVPALDMCVAESALSVKDASESTLREARQKIAEELSEKKARENEDQPKKKAA